MTDLTMLRTVIGGQTAPDDYIVIWDELTIGRIFRSVSVGGTDGWSWAVILPNVPQRDEHRGGARNLAEAKVRFRKAGDELQTQIGYDQIKEAREMQGRRAPVAPLRTPGWLLHESGTYVRLLTRARICWKRLRLQPEAA